MNIRPNMRWFALMLSVLLLLIGCGGGGGGGNSNTPSVATYSVTYDGNGNTSGSAPVDTAVYSAGQVVTVLDNTGVLDKTGYQFSGWNTQPDGSGTTYTHSQTFSMGTANVTLYAKWTANPTYTVTYDGNGNTGGTVPVDSTHYEQGVTLTVLGNSGNLVKSGYTFAGWNTQADGLGIDYAATGAATLVMGAANMTLYAKWTANPTYTVTYDGNGNTGGSVPVDSTHYEQGVTVTVLGNSGNLVKSGYTFAGWNTQADGLGTDYAATGSATLLMGTGNVTLHAKWTANPTYTVTYDGNGSTGGLVPVDSTHYEQGVTVTVLGNSGNLVKSGYTFVGWNTQADGLGTDYAATGSATLVMGAANVTLYAKWTVTGSGTVVISQIYGGGGNTGAAYMYDYVELRNLGSSAVDMSGWSLQYASASGNFTLKIDIPSGATLAGNGYYLIQLASGGANGLLLPNVDLVAASPYNMGATAGKVALVSDGTLLSCGAALTPCNTSTILDMVGYGATATLYEGTAAAPSPSNANAVFRRLGGCYETNDNLNDFTAYPAAPRNSATVASKCGALNGTGDPQEADYCVIQYPTSISVAAGNSSGNILGDIYEPGVTEAAGAAANITAQLGYGPSGTDPTASSVGWTYVNAVYSSQVGNNDEYAASFTAPMTPGQYGYVFRFSQDNGLSYTYCDTDGAGSTSGYTYSSALLGILTVN